MKFSTYLKERIGFVGINGIIFVVLLIILMVFRTKLIVILMLGVTWFLPLMSYMIIEYMKYKHYYQELEETFENLEIKYLLTQVIKEPSFAEGKIFFEILRKTNKSMHEQVNKYEGMQKEYKEYIESWIHEIKTPIAAVNLIIANNKDVTTQKIAQEIKQIECYTEQALYYARSNDVNKDYLIKPFTLRKVVMSVIQDHSTMLIQHRIMPEIGALEEVIYSDYKWVKFILNQIIGNSIKYAKTQSGTLKIYTHRLAQCVILTVEDEGIGINEKDVERVFDKGFTGENGRQFIKSTGIGLYLCKKLCNKLGLGLTLESEAGVGTKVKLIFPVSENSRVD
ncbi:MAG: sensor histidine kinase [Cellulosilyticaceae bacterium]